MNAISPSTPAGHGMQSGGYRLRRTWVSAALFAAVSGPAAAFTATLNPASPQTIYLQVGVGAFTNDYIYGGQPEDNTTVNTVTATVTSAALGNGTAQAMTTNSTAAISYWDGFLYCSVPAQLYIGGFYRTTGATTAAAQVTATVPTALTDSTGDSIPFSKIQWTSSGNLDTGAEPFPAGTFVSGGVQTVGSMASNTWNESCWTFSYSNNTVPPVGTYTGVVLYTMTAP
jgi:hypothetical protein